MRIGRALERLMSGRTSVTIAHRLSTAENADEVVVVDRGRIVQRGPHAELVGQEGIYADLHASWVAQQTERRPGLVHLVVTRVPTRCSPGLVKPSVKGRADLRRVSWS